MWKVAICVCVCVCVQIEVSSRCVHARERIKEPVMICEIKFNTSCVYIHLLYGPIYEEFRCKSL